MQPEWYYAVAGGQQAGPVSADRIREMLSTGSLKARDLVWKQGMPQWAAVSSVPELMPAARSQPAPPVFSGAPPPRQQPAAAPRPSFQAVRQRRFKPATSWLDLFDWKFEKYLTPWIVRITWLVCLAVASIWLASIVFFTLRSWLPEGDSSDGARAFRSSARTLNDQSSFPPQWLTSRIASTIAGFTGVCFVVVALLWIRVVLETSIVLFNIATTLTSIDEKTAST